MFKKALHFNIIVADYQSSFEFYTRILGFEVVKEFEIGGLDFVKGVLVEDAQARVAHLKMPGLDMVLEISEYINGSSQLPIKDDQANEFGFRHIALQVEEIETVYQRLQEQGVRFFSEPVTINNPESLKGIKYCYFYDPDGNIWELNQQR